MGFVLSVTAGLVVWIVLWSLGAKSIDAFLITTLVATIAIAVRIVLPSLPGGTKS